MFRTLKGVSKPSHGNVCLSPPLSSMMLKIKTAVSAIKKSYTTLRVDLIIALVVLV